MSKQILNLTHLLYTCLTIWNILFIFAFSTKISII
nr:MAG TPA: hypothetical protein [Crassvirales sp.]